MIDIKNVKECCGCNACGDACPQGAITFEEDVRGFLRPVVDHGKCSQCQSCRKVCPVINSHVFSSTDKSALTCFAAVHKNFSILFGSAAGGAFSALANVIYRQGGFVGGAVWTEGFGVRHFLSDDKHDLSRLRGVKYAQSDARGFFKSVQEAVETGRPVLVCGTPCQMAALRLFWGGQVPDNLLLVDLVCNGAVSPAAWRSYLADQEKQVGDQLVLARPMNKEYAWFARTIKLIFKHKRIVYDTIGNSSFTSSLVRGELSRESCDACAYKGVPHVADISLAECVDNKFLERSGRARDIGCTLAIVHTDKGRSLWDKASESLQTKQLSWQEACADNPLLTGGQVRVSAPRGPFVLRAIRLIVRAINLVVMRPGDLYRLIRDNGIVRILCHRPVIASGPSTYLRLKGKVTLEGKFTLARFNYGLRHARTAVVVEPGGELEIKGETELHRGADVEVLRGGRLVFDGGTRFNTGATISCAELIKVGKGVMAGPNVTIRDNNGGHWINLPGYRNAKPVEIGEHAWLCEGCTVMPGVKIGAGAVIGAKAVVFSNVPANTMVVGNPAEVVCEDIEWKY